MKIKVFLMICSLLVSCVDKKKDSNNVDRQIVYTNDFTNIEFPDTVSRKVITEGVINYNLVEYNLFRNSIGYGKVSRFIEFYPYLAKNKIIAEENFIIKDTFYTQNVNKILFNVKFDSIGIYYLNGIIKDMVIWDTITNVNSMTSKLPAKFNYSIINKKVVVIDKE